MCLSSRSRATLASNNRPIDKSPIFGWSHFSYWTQERLRHQPPIMSSHALISPLHLSDLLLTLLSPPHLSFERRHRDSGCAHASNHPSHICKAQLERSLGMFPATSITTPAVSQQDISPRSSVLERLNFVIADNQDSSKRQRKRGLVAHTTFLPRRLEQRPKVVRHETLLWNFSTTKILARRVLSG